jgi:hypothetical protein
MSVSRIVSLALKFHCSQLFWVALNVRLRCRQLVLQLRYWQTFEELILLAEQGDQRKVDQLIGDLKKKDRKDVDSYSLMPDETTTFVLGKLAEERYDGKLFLLKESVVYQLFEMHQCSKGA